MTSFLDIYNLFIVLLYTHYLFFISHYNFWYVQGFLEALLGGGGVSPPKTGHCPIKKLLALLAQQVIPPPPITLNSPPPRKKHNPPENPDVYIAYTLFYLILQIQRKSSLATVSHNLKWVNMTYTCRPTI